MSKVGEWSESVWRRGVLRESEAGNAAHGGAKSQEALGNNVVIVFSILFHTDLMGITLI